jgi:hypothetical protein
LVSEQVPPPPRNKDEKMGCNIMMIPESNGRDLGNPTKESAHRIS